MIPVAIEYNVTIDDSRFLRYSANGEKNEKEARKELNEKFIKLGEFLKNRNYQFKPLHNDNYQIHGYVGFLKSGYTIELNKLQELNKLVEELKTLDYIRASLGQMKFENESIYEKKLFRKLMLKAKNKAEMIAELSDLTLGKIIEFKEV